MSVRLRDVENMLLLVPLHSLFIGNNLLKVVSFAAIVERKRRVLLQPRLRRQIIQITGRPMGQYFTHGIGNQYVGRVGR